MNCPKCQAQLSATARFCERCGSMLNDPGNPGLDPLLGRVLLERYRVLEAIGQGGMGAVYLAEQRMGQATRKVAIKALRRDLAWDAQLTSRFHRESEIVIQLSHPNIIQFHDFGELDDGTLIIVMEYIEGGTLQSLLKQTGALEMARAEHLLEQIVGALEEAHRHGVVHRDLKPQNILISERAGDPDFVKVVDFGIAMRSGAEGAEEDTRLTSKGTVIGTPAYMSPEQFRGEEPDVRADVYSLSVIAYEMLTGKLPLQARTPWEWASQHLNTEPEPFATHAATTSLPPRVAGAVMRGLSKDRERRWSDARSFMHALRGTVAEPAGATRVLPRARREALRLDPDEPSGPESLPLAQTARAPISPEATGPRRRSSAGWIAGVALLLGGGVLAFGARLAPEPLPVLEPRSSPTVSMVRERPRRAAAPEPAFGAEPVAVAVAPPVTGQASPITAVAPDMQAPTEPAVEQAAVAVNQPTNPAAPGTEEDRAPDPNQLLAQEGAAALDEGRLDFAITALETAEEALGHDDAAVTALRTAIRSNASPLLARQVRDGLCAEARRGVERLAHLGLAPTPDPLAEPGACTPIAPGEPPPP
jgi:serine/threonine protein kinase